LRKGGNYKRLQRLAFDFDFAFTLPANREGHDVQSCRKADTTVEERRLSAA
jgi:hypothetical protein